MLHPHPDRTIDRLLTDWPQVRILPTEPSFQWVIAYFLACCGPAMVPGQHPGAASPAATAPDWLYHHLTISDPAETVASFAAAARGSGVIPWQLEFSAIEEDIFIRVVSQPAGRRNLTIEEVGSCDGLAAPPIPKPRFHA